ncbi:MAG: class I tRNA ligase family protein [Patescibacteria group bacterium]
MSTENHFYNHKKQDPKWQKQWLKDETYKTAQKSTKKKMYVLDMFPYPSGAGLHVGHPRGYIASDVFARMKRMQGYNVLHPMGYDAFGLPAEQYAVKHKVHPRKAVEVNVKTFERQLGSIGLSFDWSRKINTTDPEYYKWTQWIFLKLYDSWYDTKKNKARPIKELIEILSKKKEWKTYTKKEKEDILMGYRLAYQGYSEVNWCPGLGTVLANDEIVDGKSERGGFPVEKKIMRQWFMRITAYADRLLSGLDGLDWPEAIKTIQRNWIGKSEGHEVTFKVVGSIVEDASIVVYTTRLDTLNGVTFMAVSKNHPLAGAYFDQTKEWLDDHTGEKKGILIAGVHAIHPDSKKQIPIYVTNYVLSTYGTGAVMGVPDMDERDYAFAEKYKIEVTKVNFENADIVAKRIKANATSTYKMRDAVFARQRYWGEPIPLRHNADGTITPLKASELPLMLPNVKSYEPTGTGESPLAAIKSWVKEGYETNTMPGWSSSSWYFLRYMDPTNTKAVTSPAAVKMWKQVDVYVGGAEHATGHLLYARFWNKFLYDIGIAVTEEPFKKFRNQGMILGPDNRKMSKSWGNVINPDECIDTYGTDAFRMYEMFIGPFDSSMPWSTESIIGSRRFVDRVWRLHEKILAQSKTVKSTVKVQSLLHKTIKKVTDDIENFNFNTVVSAYMILLNGIEEESISQSDFEAFIVLIAPFAISISEEIWKNFGHTTSVHLAAWPTYNAKKVVEESVTIGIQVNGKLRGEISVTSEEEEKDVIEKALAIIAQHIEGKSVKKTIYVKGKIISVVIA